MFLKLVYGFFRSNQSREISLAQHNKYLIKIRKVKLRVAAVKFAS